MRLSKVLLDEFGELFVDAGSVDKLPVDLVVRSVASGGERKGTSAPGDAA